LERSVPWRFIWGVFSVLFIWGMFSVLCVWILHLYLFLPFNGSREIFQCII
jgi:hypothetical protein